MSPARPCPRLIQGAHGQMTGDEGAVQGAMLQGVLLASVWLRPMCVCMAESVLCAQMICICARDGVRSVCVAELDLCAWLSWICVRG